MSEPKSIALLSGGLDSCVAAAIANDESNLVFCLSVFYGQKHQKELDRACQIARYFGKEWVCISIPAWGEELKRLHATALVDPTEEIPKDRAMSAMTARVPRSYVPGRNTVMLALAQSIAESLNADRIYTGFNAVDFSGYPDCRPIYVEAWNHLAHYSTKRGYENNPITLVTPIINLSKASVIRRGLDLRAPLELTWSCYNPIADNEFACGQCDSCIIRWNAFQENGINDPGAPYAVTPKRSVL